MRRHILMAVYFGIFGFTGRAVAQASVNSSDRPIYHNFPYGYVVKLPPDITYTLTVPPNPNRGIGVDQQGANKLWVDASYTDSFSNDDESALVTTGCHLDTKRITTLGRQAALALRFACPATANEGAYTELLTFTVYSQGDRSPADYQVGLRVYGTGIPAKKKALFDTLVAGFSFEK
jgi:hypothetical protein